MKGWQQPAERFPGMPRPPRKERSGAGIVVAPDKENTFEPQNQRPSLDNRKSTVEDDDEHNVEGAPIIAPSLSPAERMAARLLEARRRGIQGLVLVSSRDQDDVVPSSGLPPIRNEIDDDHQKLDETIGGEEDPIRLDNDAAAKALSAADEELRKFFYPQMVSTDFPASSPIETAETFSSTIHTSPPLEETLTSNSGSLEASIIVPPSDLQRIPDASNCDEENDQELQDLLGGAAPSNDPEGFLVKVFSPMAEEVELLLNTESNDQIVAMSQVKSIDESTADMKTAPSADTIKSHVALSQVKSIDESTADMKTAPSADTMKSNDGAGVEVAELPEVNGSDETVVVINTSLSNCAKISTDQSSTNESSSEEEDELEDQDTWSAATPRNDTNCFAEVFSPLAEEVMLLMNLGAKTQIPALPEGDEIEEPNAIPAIMPSADGPIPLSGDQSSVHANEESVKVAVLSDAAPAAPANHDLPKAEVTDLHTASKSGGLCCFAGPVDMLMDDELAALIDATDDVAIHVTSQAAPNSTVAPKVVEKKATSTLLACPDSSDEKCAEEMEGVALSPRSVSALDGHIVISAEDEVEGTSPLKEETIESAIEHDESNPKDITTSSTCEALELKTADTAINDHEDIESITSTEAATSALIGEPTSEPANEHGASTTNAITAAPTSESMELITTGTAIDDQVQDAELDASTEAAASALLEESTEKATELGGPSPEDTTTISTSETASTTSKLEMATAVTLIDEQQSLDVESAATAEEATPSAPEEDMRLEGPIALGEPTLNEIATILTSNPPKVVTAGCSITDHAQDAESDTSTLRDEGYVETAIQHGSPAPKDSTTTSAHMTLEEPTTVSVIEDQTEDDVESDATAAATAPSSLRGEVIIEPALDSGESKQASTTRTLDVATASSCFDQDVEFDASTVAATSGVQEDKNFEAATEHRELKSSDITFSSTITTLEAATTGAVIDNQAHDAESETSIETATSAQSDEREVKDTTEHGGSAPKDISTSSSSTALEISIATSVIDDEAQDVESDTSIEAATSSSRTEEDTLKPAIEHEGSKANNITTSPTNKTPEMAAAAAAMRRSARRRLRNLNINRSRHNVHEGREDNGKGN